LPHGWIILDKPLELGSTQAVAALKRNLREAGFIVSGRGKKANKLKVGHGGTLDPLATGVLPLAIGEATKLCGRMLDASKVYEFTIEFGATTDTLDLAGEVVETSVKRPKAKDVREILTEFTGDIAQIPPQYSALKIDGKRAYDLARAGENIEMKKRMVTIFDLSLCHAEPVSRSASSDAQHLQSKPPLNKIQDDERLQSVTLIAHVSKGTYIRSLARDIAHALGTVGHVVMLRRTKAGPFSLKQAISLDKLNEIGKGAGLNNYILPFEAGLDDIPALNLISNQADMLRKGQALPLHNWIGDPPSFEGDTGLYLARDAKSPVALVKFEEEAFRVVRGFNFDT